MPREKIELPYTVEQLSILDPKGQVDAELEPDLPEELLRKMYRFMLLGRRFDERMLTLQRQGKIGTFGPIKGQEASQVGAVATLGEKDWLVPSFREMAAELWRGKPLFRVLLLYGGYNEGGEIEEGRKDLPICIPVATHLPYAVGIGHALKLRGEEGVVMAFFGDGATSEGDFHEASNFAGVFRVPIVFVCQNNQWAISVPRSRQTRSQTLAQKALAQGFPGIQVDGNDVLAVYVAAREAVERARAGEGPTLIECVTYRMEVHTTADDPSRYREEKETEEWKKKDPIDRFRTYLTKKGVLSDEGAESLEGEIKTEIQEAVDAYEKRSEERNDPLVMFDHVLEELPRYLREQREELERESGRSGREEGHG
jgi:pyruvate dehydrogenase E1 component alpha subunit